MRTLVGLLVALAWMGAASAQSPNELLQRMDQAEYAARDTVAEVKMILVDEAGRRSERTLKMWQKGVDRRLIRFLSPADVRGVAFLDVAGKMYVFFPAFHKVRRVAGSVKNENFAGTDFAHTDLSSEKFSKRLQALEVKPQGEYFLLTTREKEDPAYSKLVFRVRRKDYLFDRVEYYDQGGQLQKVFERRDFRPVGKYVQSFRARMTDKKRNHTTEMIVTKLEVDTGLSDNFFSKRRLKRF